MKLQSVQLKTLEHQHLLRQRLPLQHHDQETIHFQQVAQFHAHHVLVTIHFQQVAQFHAHHSVPQVDKEVEHHVQVWPVHVPDLFVQVLLHVQVHRALQVADLLHAQADHLLHHPLPINQIRQELAHQVVAHSVPVAVVHHNVVAQAEHLERMQVRSQDVNKSLVRRYVMSSTICRHHNLEQSHLLEVFQLHH